VSPDSGRADRCLAYWNGEKKMRNFHVPLRELRNARHEAIAAYAEEMAGTNLDIDSDLESAGIELLLKTGKEPK
jgi:hypothetical protein